jgi:transcriptional regulator with XRE-family HTH domain
MAYRTGVTDFDRAVSAYIRGTAGIKKLSQTEMAERTGISFGSFRRYWHGESSITLGDFRLILQALDVTPEQATKEIWRLFEAGEYPR